MAGRERTVRVYRVHSRNLDDRIRELCAKAVTAADSELEPVQTELREALREHNERLRRLAAKAMVNSNGD